MGDVFVLPAIIVNTYYFRTTGHAHASLWRSFHNEVTCSLEVQLFPLPSFLIHRIVVLCIFFICCLFCKPLLGTLMPPASFVCQGIMGPEILQICIPAKAFESCFFWMPCIWLTPLLLPPSLFLFFPFPSLPSLISSLLPPFLILLFLPSLFPLPLLPSLSLLSSSPPSFSFPSPLSLLPLSPIPSHFPFLFPSFSPSDPLQ